MSHLPLLLAASLLCDLVLAWLLLRRGPLTLPRLLRAGAWGLVGALVQGALAQALLGRAFLAIHFVHTWLFVAAPVACAAALLAARRGGGSGAGRLMAASAVLLLPALLAWTSLVEPYGLRLEQVDVPLPAARAPQPPLRIGVLSDLQCSEVGAHEREAVATLMAQKPDLILLPGDVQQTFSPEEFAALEPPLRALLGELDAPLGVFMVLGNCDSGQATRRLIAGTHVQLLVDETVHLQTAGRGIALCGLTLGIGAPPAQAALDELEAAPDGELRLVLAHYPDAALQLQPGTRVDLVVAGHTHGGQVRLPWFGPLITLSHVPREVAGGGLHALNGTQIYVSRGVGVERGDAPRIRFNCLPEVSLLTLGGTLSAP